MKLRKETTDWLHIKVSIYKDRSFGLVVTDPPQDHWGKLQVLTLHCVCTKINGFGLDTVLSQ